MTDRLVEPEAQEAVKEQLEQQACALTHRYEQTEHANELRRGQENIAHEQIRAELERQLDELHEELAAYEVLNLTEHQYDDIDANNPDRIALYIADLIKQHHKEDEDIRSVLGTLVTEGDSCPVILRDADGNQRPPRRWSLDQAQPRTPYIHYFWGVT